ncbi:PKD domain-containing protein [bacterium]|nr:PKD domain-containing protein [bacterium]
MAGNCIAIIRLGSTIILCLALASCAGLRQDLGTAVSDSNTGLAPEYSAPGGTGQAGWPVGLPVDQAQPWEKLDSEGYVIRQSSAINAQSDFTPGVERFDEAGDVSDLGEASRFASGAAGAGTLSYALYRITLGAKQPGVVSADVNLRLHDGGGSISEYWLGLSSYGAGTWDWRGPFSDSHVRIGLGNAVAGGADYTSDLGNLFVAVLAYDGASFDLVGFGVNEYDAADTTAPPAPSAPVVSPVAGGVLAEWIPVAAGDFAGYRIYYAGADFADGTEPFVRTLDYLEGATRHVLPGFSGHTHVRVSAVDTSGNESALSDIGKAIMLPGSAPVLALSTDIVSGKLGAVAMLSATGAESYDWDIDGDGVYDITDDTTGQATVDTSATGIIRPGVRGVSDGPGGPGTSIALGGVSLIITGNTRPVASATANPQSGQSPLDVTFVGTAEDAEDDVGALKFAWDFDGDGIFEPDTNTLLPAVQQYTTPGLFNVKFRVEDSQGSWDVDTVTVQVFDPSVNQPPHAHIRANRSVGDAPFTVEFDASDSADLDGSITLYEWDWESDGTYDENTGPTASHTYDEASFYTATVRVTDDDGADDTASISIVARGYRLETPDSTENVGRYTSLAVVNGNPAISYRDNTNLDLKYVRASNADGTAWNTPVTPESTGNVGAFTSLAVVNGHPAISYFYSTNGDLKYVRASDADGTSWDFPRTLDTAGTVGLYTSLAVVNGNPAVSYYDDTNFDLKYVRASDADGALWGAPVTPDSAGVVGASASLAVVNGNPAISYFDDINFNLKYVRASDADGASWGAPLTLDSTGSVGSYTSIAVVNGNAAISYHDITNGDLKYALIIE